jgi:RimJ/RimL family protein N-acetyltransferase
MKGISMPLNLSGEKVFLRPLEERDLTRFVDAYKDLDLQLTTDGDAPPMSDIQVKAFWSDILTDPDPDLRYFAIEPLTGQTSAGAMVGACNLQHIDLRSRHAELSIFMVNKEVRGLGYGTDAVRVLLRYGFEALRLDKVYLGVYEFNEGGLQSYEKAGFRYEGRHRQMIHYDGRYWDEWMMGILRSEWEATLKPPADGLRPYHPADLEPALTLIQKLLQDENTEGKAYARALLRRWWRQTGHSVYTYQVKGQVLAVMTLLDNNGGKPLIADVLVDESDRAGLLKALQSQI